MYIYLIVCAVDIKTLLEVCLHSQGEILWKCEVRNTCVIRIWVFLHNNWMYLCAILSIHQN